MSAVYLGTWEPGTVEWRANRDGLETVWCSGCTDSAGVIVDGNGDHPVTRQVVLDDLTLAAARIVAAGPDDAVTDQQRGGITLFLPPAQQFLRVCVRGSEFAAHLVMELIHDAGIMTSLEVVETNPILDVRNATAILGAELALSAMGKRIL